MNATNHTSEERYEIPITIDQSDIDIMGHVNNVVYLRWVQDAAIAHWRARATSDQQEKWKWVVVRHEIDYKRPARLGENIIARTWVGQATDMTFERHTEIIRTGDQKLLARALTLWCPVNAKSGKPSRVDDDVRKQFSVSTSHETQEGQPQ